MFRYCLLVLISTFVEVNAFSQQGEIKKKSPFGVSIATSYTVEGHAYNFLVEWTKKNNSFYAGPKLMAKRTYNPMKGICGWDVGYRRRYASGKLLSCFFNLDFQGRMCRNYDVRVMYRLEDMVNPKINYALEAFVGNSILLNVFNRFNIGNTIGAGGYWDSNYSYTRVRKTSMGKNMLLTFFLNYKL